MAKCSIVNLKRQLDKVEERLEFMDRPPCFIIAFLWYDDGTVPNVIDRELADWELIKQNAGSSVISLSPLHEYELRRGWTKVSDTMNLSPDFPTYEPDKMPEAPEKNRIPTVIFNDWLGPAMNRFRLNWTK